jgi:hypothetical protein
VLAAELLRIDLVGRDPGKTLKEGTMVIVHIPGPIAAILAVIVGFVMPPIIDTINRGTWSSELKALAAFVLCIPGALLVVYVTGYWNIATPDDWLRTFLIVFAAAIAFHRFYWKPSEISDVITRATG